MMNKKVKAVGPLSTLKNYVNEQEIILSELENEYQSLKLNYDLSKLNDVIRFDEVVYYGKENECILKVEELSPEPDGTLTPAWTEEEEKEFKEAVIGFNPDGSPIKIAIKKDMYYFKEEFIQAITKYPSTAHRYPLIDFKNSKCPFEYQTYKIGMDLSNSQEPAVAAVQYNIPSGANAESYKIFVEEVSRSYLVNDGNANGIRMHAYMSDETALELFGQVMPDGSKHAILIQPYHTHAVTIHIDPDMQYGKARVEAV